MITIMDTIKMKWIKGMIMIIIIMDKLIGIKVLIRIIRIRKRIKNKKLILIITITIIIVLDLIRVMSARGLLRVIYLWVLKIIIIMKVVT